MSKRHSLCKLKPGSKAYKLLWYLGNKGAVLKWIKPIRPIFLNLKNFQASFYVLKHDGFLETKGRKIKFSENGIIEYIRTKLDETDQLPKGTDCIVVFDVPEKNRKVRKLLNKLLIELAFIKIQKSVWISPFDNAKTLKKLLIMLKIKKWVRIFTGKEE